jgi:transcriptional regulator with XRE-family HTH domain
LVSHSRGRSSQPTRGDGLIPEADKIDEHVGRRLRQGREASRLSKDVFAAVLGITLPELDEIETGKARLTPAQVLAASNALSVEPIFFFESFEKSR